jgi:hypothetical protein
MANYLASVDAGNGGTNAVLLKGKAKNPKSYYMPSVRAAATGESLGLSQFEMDYEYVDWYGNRYVVGDDVVRVTRRHLERHLGQDRYANEFHQFLVAVALAKLGVTTGKVNLTLFCPPSLFTQHKQNMVDTFQKTPVKLSMKGDKKPREWSYEQVSVYPEGIGAVSCFVFDAEGNVVDQNLLQGQTVVLDCGLWTLDTLILSDGNFNPEALQTATNQNAGVQTHIREPLLKTLHDTDEDFTVLTVDDVDLAIRNGLTNQDYTVSSGGKEIDMKPILDKLSERYAGWIANNIIDSQLNGLRGIRSAILVGGGATLVDSYLRRWYGDKILDHSTHEATKDIHPVDMNAVGGLRLALMQQKQTMG